MSLKKTPYYKRPIILLPVIIIVIRLLTLNEHFVEAHYSTGLYVYVGEVYRYLFGWIPFSLGDILYTVVGAYIIGKFINFSITIYKKQYSKPWLIRKVKSSIVIAASIYIIFNINWGLNYNRLGIAYQLKIDPTEHTEADLQRITDVLLYKVNETSRAVDRKQFLVNYKNIFTDAVAAYKSSERAFPFLVYENRSIKRSMYGRVGNVLGFLGYYNPFTGESQLNLTQPRFLIPFVTCHEMAHQLGYANESEANFVGYLTAVKSSNPVFHYSAYFDLFNYANRELALRDSTRALNNYEKLDPLVKMDIAELKGFYKKYRNPLEPIIKVFYDQYLKANQQTKGLQSYSQVVGLLIAYYKVYGKI